MAQTIRTRLFAVESTIALTAARLMLRRRGIATVTRFGVAHGHKANLIAHAWLLVDGATIVGGGEERRFGPITDFHALAEKPPRP